MSTTATFVNFRDVGGVSAADGRPVRRRLLFRSDHPAHLDRPTRTWLAGIPLVRVVDLRDDAEVQSTADVFGCAGFPVVRVPVFQGSAESFIEEGYDLDRLYHHMLEESGTRLAEAVHAVASAPRGAVLIHCTVGKDRTGLVIALVLGALGVRRYQIVADYARTQENLTQTWLERRVRELSGLRARDLESRRELLAGSPPRVMEEVLRRLDQDWGSPAGYLRAHGLGVGDLTALRARLLASSEVAA